MYVYLSGLQHGPFSLSALKVIFTMYEITISSVRTLWSAVIVVVISAQLRRTAGSFHRFSG